MKNTTRAANDAIVQRVKAQFDDLIDEIKKTNRDTDASFQKTQNAIRAIDADVDKSVGVIDRLLRDLDHIEKEAGDELDALALRQAEDLTSE